MDEKIKHNRGRFTMKITNHIEEQSVIWLKPRFVKGMCMHTTQLCSSFHNPDGV